MKNETEQKSIIVKANELAAVALAASNEKTRYYLNGVYFEQYESGGVAMVATDGHRLHSIGVKEGKDAEVIQRFIVPNETIEQIMANDKQAKKQAGRTMAGKIRVFIQRGADNLKITIGMQDENGESFPTMYGEFAAKEVDGTFPDYRRIIPTISHENATAVIGFNANYLADFGKAASLVTGDKTPAIKIEFGEAGAPALIKTNSQYGNANDFVGVLMPMRT